MINGKKIKALARVISLGLMIVCIAGSFAGCTPSGGGDTTTADAEPTDNPQTNEEPQTTEEPQTEEPIVTTEEQTQAPENEPLPFDEKINVLFIGNSYTYYNDMPVIFRSLAISAGYKKTGSVSITKGAYTLEKFSSASDPMGQQVETMLKGTTKFDYIVIQEQSERPASDPALFYDGVRAMAAKIKQYQPDAKVVLYATWGRKAGHSTLTKHGWTTEQMHTLLRSAYDAIGEEMGFTVSHAGAAFLDVYTNKPSLELYNADKTHPSPAGSYLIACVHYATIFGRSPVGIEYTAGLSAEDAKYLQEAAYRAVFELAELPEADRQSSVGVTAVGRETPNLVYGDTVNLASAPKSTLLTIVDGSDGKRNFTGIRGDKNAVCSSVSGSSFTDAQLADLADIGYGVSLFGAASIPTSTKVGETFTALQALVNGHWGSSYMANFKFGSKKYDVSGKEDASGKYVGLITLNFGSKKTFDAIGYYSGNLQGFPQAADVYVSDDGVNWTLVPSASYNAAAMAKDNKTLLNAGQSTPDLWPGYNNVANASCFFSMNGTSGKYIRIGVILGKGDPATISATAVQEINTRELVVYGN